MNLIKHIFPLVFLLVSFTVCAQPPVHHCKGYGTQKLLAAKNTVADVREDNYDVKHVLFNLHFTDTAIHINGSVITTATARVTISEYVFELDTFYVIDSAIVNNVAVSVSRHGQVCTAALPGTLPAGALFRAQVYYHTGNVDSTTDTRGIFHDASDITFTSVEPYNAHRWWPCKQSLLDKIDSIDVFITVPAGVKAGSNGILKEVTAMPGGMQRFWWHSNYPIDYYLISVTASRFADYSYRMLFSDGTRDTMQMVNYIPASQLARVQPWLDSTALLVNYFSSLWGRYPFWKEKYGHCFIPFGASMEHQTMTSTSFSGLSVVAHELAHQWFGNRVTCATWKDIWINEGFATYAQYLVYNHFHSRSAGLNYLDIIHRDATKDSSGSVYVPDTTNTDRIFLGRLSYSKAASVIHMLRYVINNDERFHLILRTFLERYAWGNATTEYFKTVAEEISGLNLQSFFTQWVYSEGYPLIATSWLQQDDKVFLNLTQRNANPSSINTFHLLLPITFHSSGGDSTIIIPFYSSQKDTSFVYEKVIDSISIDADKWLLQKQERPVLRDLSLGLLPGEAIIYPNPVADMFFIAYKYIDQPTIAIYDATGRKCYEQSLPHNARMATINVPHLPHGVYVYRLISANGTVKEGKLLKE